jgi:hypothetical protein
MRKIDRRKLMQGAAAVGSMMPLGVGVSLAEPTRQTDGSGVFIDWVSKVITVTKPTSLKNFNTLIKNAEDDMIYGTEFDIDAWFAANNICSFMDMTPIRRHSDFMFSLDSKWSLADGSIENLFGGAIQIGEELYASVIPRS